MAKMHPIPVDVQFHGNIPAAKLASEQSNVKVPPIKLRDLMSIMGEDFELVITRMMDPSRQGLKLAEFAAPMSTEQATTLLLGLQHYGEVGVMPVDESAQLSEMDELDKELGKIDG